MLAASESLFTIYVYLCMFMCVQTLAVEVVVNIGSAYDERERTSLCENSIANLFLGLLC